MHYLANGCVLFALHSIWFTVMAQTTEVASCFIQSKSKKEEKSTNKNIFKCVHLFLFISIYLFRISQFWKMPIYWKRQKVKTSTEFQYGWCGKQVVTYLNFRYTRIFLSVAKCFHALLLDMFVFHLLRKYENIMISLRFVERPNWHAKLQCSRYVALTWMLRSFSRIFL